MELGVTLNFMATLFLNRGVRGGRKGFFYLLLQTLSVLSAAFAVKCFRDSRYLRSGDPGVFQGSVQIGRRPA